jgi:opacity protein-like surface antigen
MDALDPSGIYLGFGVGQAKVNDWAQYSTTFVNESFVVSSPVSDDKRSLGFKVFGGYQFNKYFGVEGGFVDFNDVKASSTITGPARGVYTTAENDAWTLAAVGTLPVTKRVSVFAKLGASSWSSNLRSVATDVNGVTTSATEGSNGYDVFYGLGASYALLDSIDVRAEIERYKFDNLDIDLMTAGMAFKF